MANRIFSAAAIALLLAGSSSAFAGASLLSMAQGQDAVGAGAAMTTQAVCPVGATKILASAGVEQSCIPVDQISCVGDTSKVGLPGGKDFDLPDGTRVEFPNGSAVTLPATAKVILTQGSMVQLPAGNACAMARPAPPKVGGGLSFWQSGLIGLGVASGTAAVASNGRPFSP